MYSDAHPHREGGHEACQDGEPYIDAVRQRAALEQRQRRDQQGEARRRAGCANVQMLLPDDAVDEDDGDHGDHRLDHADSHGGAQELALRPDAGVAEYGQVVLTEDDDVITINAVDAGVGAHLEQPSTPKPKPSRPDARVVSCTEYFFIFIQLVMPSQLLIQFYTCIGHKLQRIFEA